MADVITNDGLDLVEDVSVGDSTETLDTIAVGTSTSSPSTSDSSMYDEVYSADASVAGVTIDTGSGATGEMRFAIEVTGGTEVPADSDITEIGIIGSDDTLVYHEIRPTAISVPSGESRTIETKLFVRDHEDNDSRVITDVGRDSIAGLLLGDNSDTIDTISIGESDNESGLGSDDTVMFDEVYRSDDSDSSVSVSSTSRVGEINSSITVSAGSETGDEVPANTSVSEFGVLTESNTLVLHEIRTPVILQATDTKTFKIPFTIVQ